MNTSAGVNSIQAIKDFRASLCNFAAQAREILYGAEAQARRALDGLAEQGKYWNSEIRKREEAVGVAKRTLKRKELERMTGRIPDTTVEEKALKLAQRRLQEAHDKTTKVRRWLPALQRAVLEYEGKSRNLAVFLESDLPRARAWLDQRTSALDAYVALAPQDTGGGP